MSIAVITNCAPPYRVPLFKKLADELDATFYFHGKELPNASVDELPFPACYLSSQMKTWRALSDSDHRAVICGLGGRIALPLAYLASRHADKPFILWASLWSHPQTLFHRLSSIPLSRIYRGADAVVTYGPHVSEYVARQRNSRTGIFEATQAVDNGFFSRQVGSDEQESLRGLLDLGMRPIVLFVGRLVEEKGLHYLLEAWKLVDRKNGGALIVAGEGPLADEEKKISGVHFIGQQSRDLLPVLYSMASALVLPSIKVRDFLEPWGLVVNEAMNQGVPAIATKSVGAVAAGLVKDSSNGLVVPERSCAELADAINRLLGDERLRYELGAQARSDVGRYTYDLMVDGFKQALDYALPK